MDNLALKYRPKEFTDVVEQSTVVNMLQAMCEEPELPNRNFLLVGPRGCGKAQPLHSKVLTTSGFITMGELSIGQEVFTAEGNQAKVVDIFPQGLRDIYQINFDDGSYIEVSDEHLNEVIFVDPETNCEERLTLSTNDLISKFKIYRDQYPQTNVFYTFCPIVDWDEKAITVDISPVIFFQLFEYFEPTYFLNSKYQRIKLLKAFLHLCNYDNQSEYAVINIESSSSKVSDSFEFLVRSLGCKDTISIDNFEDYDVYRHYVEFSIDVHKSLVEELDLEYKKVEPYRAITSIYSIGQQECQCIMLDHDDHTYISDYFIPTHNTTLGRIVANKLNDGQGQAIELDAASHSGVDTVREIISQAALYPIGTKYKVFICDEVHAFSQVAWQSLLKTLEEQPAKSVFILLTTNPEKIPATIISRVQVFQLSNISLHGIESRLKYVIEQENALGENISYEDDAISYIAKLAKGGMRDALTNLNKALVYSHDLTLLNLKEALSLPEYDDYFDLLNFYAKRDYASIMKLVSKVYNSGLNFVKWFEGFQSFVINIAKFVFIKDINKTMIPGYYLSKVEKYSMKHAEVCLELSQILISLISNISKSEYMEEIAISYLCQRR